MFRRTLTVMELAKEVYQYAMALIAVAILIICFALLVKNAWASMIDIGR